jgi:GDPmannose 4,6-dehydratase
VCSSDLGDATKARKNLKWKPKTSFDQLVSEMMSEDLKALK